MKRFTMVEWVTFVGIGASLLLMMLAASGCSMKFYKAPKDVRQCCERVSAHAKEMEKFGRYCKVAVFLANSENTKAVGAGVRKAARQAVGVCKFVFRVETDEQLVSAGDSQDYYQALFYILDGTKGSEKPAKAEERFEWMNPLPCDPNEFACEEF